MTLGLLESTPMGGPRTAPTGAYRLVLVILALAVVLLAAPPPGPVRATAAPFLTLTYSLDWSKVPAWVEVREVTLVVGVGAAEDVVVLGDGVPLRHALDRRAGTVTFTTGAAQVQVRVWGGDPARSGWGAWRKAALRGDKKWAYSLTLDDGYESQYRNGLRYLGPYGYQGTLGVVGSYIGQTREGKSFASGVQLQALALAGWGLSNHTFSHRHVSEFAKPAQAVQDVLAGNQALLAQAAYRPLAFTAPYTDRDYTLLLAQNVGSLGLRLVQAMGYEYLRVDQINWGPDYFLTLGYMHVKPDGSQFDDMHRRALDSPNEHWWASLHSHEVEDLCDCLETSTSYLYETYGAGGTDEVWMAPAQVIYQYLVVRDRVVVSGPVAAQAVLPGEGQPPAAPAAVNGPRTASFQNGAGSYNRAFDTYIDSWAKPGDRFGSAGSLLLRSGWKSVGLLRFDLGSDLTGARILDARLELRTANNGSNGNPDYWACLSTYPLLQSWNAGLASWREREANKTWAEAGAAGLGSDRSATASDVRRYVYGSELLISVDVTSAVEGWLNGTLANNGLVLALERNSDFWYSVYSSDYPIVDKRPRLVVTYLPAGQATLNAQVLLQGRSAASPGEPLEVVLRVPGVRRPAYSAAPTADSEGRFSLSELAPGTYDLYVRGQHSLWTVLRGVALPAAGDVVVGPLREGDIDRDGLIGKSDLDLLQAGYRTAAGQPGYDPRADLNDDGRVDGYDFSLLLANYGRQAEAVP